jgi:hypothetical protein
VIRLLIDYPAYLFSLKSSMPCFPDRRLNRAALNGAAGEVFSGEVLRRNAAAER